MKKLILITLFLAGGISLPAGEILLDDSTSGELSIQKQIYRYSDTSGRLSLQDVHSGPASTRFHENSDGTSNLGYSSDALWIRIKIRKNKEAGGRRFLKLAYPHIDVIDFYTLRHDGTFSYIKTGDALPFSSRIVKSRNFIFPLDVPDEAFTLYLRLESSGAINFPLSIIDTNSFYRRDHRDQIVYGILFGILIIMILYNLFIFLSVRERVYIIYVAHIFFLTLYVAQISGYCGEYITGSFPRMNNILDLFASFGAISTVGFFLIDYLETPRIAPRLHILLKSTALASFGFMIISLFDYRSFIIYPSAVFPIVMLIIAMAISIIAVRLHMRQGWFFLSAWSILIITSGFLASSHFTGLQNSFFSRYSLPLGIVFNVVFLSLGLADRINRMKVQLSELNIGLEDKVKRRTNQLEEALTEIETTNDHLQERNSELIRAQRIARKDMAMAINVQNSFLPNVPPASDKWDIAFMYQPMMGISGDFYDFYMRDTTLSGVGIFDVSGHGIASGLVTMIAKSVILRNFFKGEGLPLEQVISLTNEDLQKEIGDVGNYITGILLRFRDDTVEYANAAHTDIMIKSRGEVYQPEEKFHRRVAGAFLGIIDFNYKYESMEFDLKKGDCIFLYTDGLNEARNGEDNTYDIQRIVSSFTSAPEASAQEILNHIILDYHDFMKDVIDQQDDITLIILKKTD